MHACMLFITRALPLECCRSCHCSRLWWPFLFPCSACWLLRQGLWSEAGVSLLFAAPLALPCRARVGCWLVRLWRFLVRTRTRAWARCLLTVALLCKACAGVRVHGSHARVRFSLRARPRTQHLTGLRCAGGDDGALTAGRSRVSPVVGLQGRALPLPRTCGHTPLVVSAHTALPHSSHTMRACACACPQQRVCRF
jgi:hypothetical protein